MTLPVTLALLALVVFLSALCSGAEIGMYSISRTQVEADAAVRRPTAQLLRSLLHNEPWLLATLLVANNLTHQAATILGEAALGPLGVPPQWIELVLALLLTPPMLLFGELLPKDLFRRRPNVLMTRCAPFLYGCRVLLAPLAYPLQLLIGGVARALGFDSGELARVRGREAVIDLLRERESAFSPHVERLARNVLELRSVRVDRVMVPWRSVECVRLDVEPAQLRAQLGASLYSRLPVVDPGGRVRGYVHQLEALGAPPTERPERLLRPLLEMTPDTPLDRALLKLKQSGQRAALVGDSSHPLGLVTLKDLVEEISGELARW